MYNLVLSKSSQKFLKKISDRGLMDKIRTELARIKEDYTIGSRKTGDLKGFWSLDVYYNKTNYEICYELIEDKGKFILVVLIGTRENFYKEVKRYIKTKH